MPREQRESDGSETTSERSESSAEREGRIAGAWFASTAVRLGLTIVGFVLLLFALGQAFGLPLLDAVADALTTQTGAWLVVAFFALLLIVAAQRGIPNA